MTKQKNKAFMVNCIKNLLITNYHINPETIDLEMEVDSSLSTSENVRIIIGKYVKPQLGAMPC